MCLMLSFYVTKQQHRGTEGVSNTNSKISHDSDTISYKLWEYVTIKGGSADNELNEFRVNRIWPVEE
jgi:hypothetical protein